LYIRYDNISYMKKLEIKQENVTALFDSKYIRIYDLEYEPGRHYLNASRRKKEDLIAIKPEKEFQNALPDAVTLCVIIRKAGEDRLFMFYEYRYPAGRFLLSPPAGLIDPEDKDQKDPVYTTAVRELFEETGLVFDAQKDFFKTINPLSFSTPGMSDESNAIALLILNEPDLSSLTDRNTVGSELFSGYRLLTREDAEKCIETGRDEYGNFFSMYAWQDILYFLSDIWRKYI